jgi:hypothetical protein
MNDLLLGRLLGRREAFNTIAGRCSAADAALLRQIREEKLYLGHAKDWREFCVKCLHISRENADRLIRLLDEFGPTYFEVAQLTRITPAVYRLIAPLIRDQTLHYNGEAIALIADNAEKVAAVADEFRPKSKTPAAPLQLPPPVEEDPIARLERRCTELVREIESAISWRSHPHQVKAIICYLRQRVDRLELTI